MNIKPKTQNLFTHPVAKMRRATRRLIRIQKWKKLSEEENADTIRENPLRRKLFLSIIFWIILHIFIFVIMIQHANDDSKLNTVEGLVCFFNPRTSQCRDETELIKIRIMYAFPVIYVYISCLQIHYGKKMLWSRVTKFTLFEKIGHLIKRKIPFGRELGIAMDFLANRSALQFRHRLIYDDISLTLRSSKFDQISRMKNGYGKKRKKLEQFMVGIGWVILFILMIFGPLIPFAWGINEKKPFEINSGKISVFVEDKMGVNVGNLFYSKINYEVKDNTFRDSLYNKLSNLEKFYVEKDQIKQLNMSTRSEIFQNIQDKFFTYRHKKDIKGVVNELLNGAIVFRLEVAVSIKNIFRLNKRIILDVKRTTIQNR